MVTHIMCSVAPATPTPTATTAREGAGSICSTLPAHWRYVNEGGATIVYCIYWSLRRSVHRHRPPPPQSRHRRRPRSSVRPRGRARRPLCRLSTPNHFQARSPFLPPDLTVVYLNREWLVSLRTLSQSLRPISRRLKDEIDITRSKGVIATDLVGAGQGGLAIDDSRFRFSPPSSPLTSTHFSRNWGFLPNTSFLSQETRPNKSLYCRHCMHAQLKEAVGEPFARNYCPLDLFSASQLRIQTAVTSLWRAWLESNASINNLRIFIDGEIVKPSVSGTSALAVSERRRLFRLRHRHGLPNI